MDSRQPDWRAAHPTAAGYPAGRLKIDYSAGQIVERTGQRQGGTAGVCDDAVVVQKPGEGDRGGIGEREDAHVFERTRGAGRALARQLGAGKVLTGTAIGALGRVTLSASLQTVADGRVRGRAAVEGPIDSLMPLVDRLTAQVLGLAAGEEEFRLEALATTSLPALRHYLDARAAYRKGEFGNAVKSFETAIAQDARGRLVDPQGDALGRLHQRQRDDHEYEKRNHDLDQRHAFVIVVSNPSHSISP